MKQLTCEMCGSTDLMKQDGVFVCQNCGCKYTVEEAKKMMVEGTVKIDNSDKLKNLYQIARQARDNNDSENAVKYYDMIMQEDPNSWEATFYNVYYRATQTTIANIASAAKSIDNSLNSVFYLLEKHVEDLSEKKLAITEIALHVTVIGELLESSARSTYKESVDSLDFKYESSVKYSVEYYREYRERNSAVYLMFSTLGICIENYYNTEEDMCKLAVNAYKKSMQYFADIFLTYDNPIDQKNSMNKIIGVKIKKYEPDYVLPRPNTNGYPNYVVKMINEKIPKIYNSPTSNSSTNSSANSSSTSSGSGGCYVATAVYGSYDCPQVWTLRRYRDYTLAKTWYGRLFIYFYYAISPTIVKWFGKTEWFKKLWKGKLDRMVSQLQENGVDNTPYDDINWR